MRDEPELLGVTAPGSSPEPDRVRTRGEAWLPPALRCLPQSPMVLSSACPQREVPDNGPFLSLFHFSTALLVFPGVLSQISWYSHPHPLAITPPRGFSPGTGAGPLTSRAPPGRTQNMIGDCTIHQHTGPHLQSECGHC